MLRQLKVALVAAVCLAALCALLVRQPAHALRAMPRSNPVLLLQASAFRFERCALQTRLPEGTLRAAQVNVTREPNRPARVEHHGVPVLPVPTLRCVTSEVRAILRAAPGAPVTEGPFVFAPFEGFDFPMEPAPPAATWMLTPAQVDAVVAELGALGDDPSRLARLAQLEAGQQAVPSTAARAVLGTFQQPDAVVAANLCRVVTGRGALRTVQAALPTRERNRLRSLTRGACGVEVLAAAQPDPGPRPVRVDPTTPGPASTAECAQDSDCVLACPVPPSCCPATCGCSHAVPRGEAAAIAAACESPPRDRRCPAMGCARQEFHAVCRAGQCRADRGMGMF